MKNDETAMKELHHALKNSDELEVPLTLGEWPTSLRFVETHRQDMRTILDSRQDVPLTLALSLQGRGNRRHVGQIFSASRS